jgi:hypothetical protein
MGQVLFKCLEEKPDYSFISKCDVEHSRFHLRGTYGPCFCFTYTSTKCSQLCISSILGVWHFSYDIADQKENPSTTTGLIPSNVTGYGTQNQSSSMGSENLREHQRATELHTTEPHTTEPQEISSI